MLLKSYRCSDSRRSASSSSSWSTLYTSINQPDAATWLRSIYILVTGATFQSTSNSADFSSWVLHVTSSWLYKLCLVFVHRHQQTLSLRFIDHFPGEPGLAGVYWSKGWWRWWVVTTGAIGRAKLQSNHHHQQTNIQFF